MTRWSEAELEAHMKKRKPQAKRGRCLIPPAQPRHTMNKLECRYRDYLEALKCEGEILHYEYEPMTLRLAAKTTYTPDFMVVYPDRIEYHETKGYWHEHNRAKWKVAAEKFWMFRFVGVQWIKKEWVFEFYGGAQV